MTVGASALTDRVVLLAGATGAVGAELLQELLARGARVGVLVRKPWQVRELVARLPAGRTLVGVVGATDSEAAAGMVKGVEDSLGPILALVSTAGAFHAAPFAAEPVGLLGSLLEANLIANATIARAVVPPMQRRRTGALVFTGAAAAETASAGMASYVASKAALHMWARSLAAELAPAGLHVTVVAPSTLDTPANRAASPEADRSRWLPVPRLVAALLAAITGTAQRPDPVELLHG